MSRLRAMAAPLCAALIHIQLFIMHCRAQMVAALLLLPGLLLPQAVRADGDLADIFRHADAGAGTAQSSVIRIAQFIGVLLFIGGLIGLKKVSKQGMGLGGCILSMVIGVLLVVIPEFMNRTQRQMGMSAPSIS